LIERYSLPEMERIWSEENKFSLWLHIEEKVTEVEARLGIIPEEVHRKLKEIREDIPISQLIKETKEVEKEVQHDVVAFLIILEEKMGPPGRFIHYGLTSSDLLDTALALQMRESLYLILEENEKVKRLLEKLAEKYKDLKAVGRTHGVHAEPLTLGLRFLGHAAEFRRNSMELKKTIEEVSYGKISGTVGTYPLISPKIEKEVLKELGLKPEPVSTQIVPRDRHSRYFASITFVGNAVERLALNLRLLHQTEIAEVREPFGKGQRGSSAMPHKRNPIYSERLFGLARLLKAYLFASLENTALWLERDISHSSVERFIFPDASGVCYYMLNLTARIIEGIEINEEKIKRDLHFLGDLLYSQILLHALIKKGASRREAYRWVQEVSLRGETGSMKENALNHREIRKFLDEKEVEEVFTHNFFKHIDEIFKRYFSIRWDE